MTSRRLPNRVILGAFDYLPLSWSTNFDIGSGPIRPSPIRVVWRVSIMMQLAFCGVRPKNSAEP
jgi:hypothetical protein